MKNEIEREEQYERKDLKGSRFPVKTKRSFESLQVESLYVQA